MTEKELRRLTRPELLELLLEQMQENEQLQSKIEEQEKQLRDRMLRMNHVGSIAEAALVLNGVFEAAEASCTQYIENIKKLDLQQDRRNAEREAESKAEAERLLEETRVRCAQMEAETRAKCDAQVSEADRRVEEKWAQISQRLTALYASHQGLMDLVNLGVTLVPKGGAAYGRETDSETKY